MKMVPLDKVNEVLEKWSDTLIDKVRESDGQTVTLDTAITILDNLQDDMNRLRSYNVVTREEKK